jgi:hypothetical protein
VLPPPPPLLLLLLLLGLLDLLVLQPVLGWQWLMRLVHRVLLVLLLPGPRAATGRCTSILAVVTASMLVQRPVAALGPGRLAAQGSAVPASWQA